MTDWTEGYVAEIGYTHGYYAELGTKRVEMALLNAGLCPPKIEAACELGFGQGLSANIHAAASDVVWYGTDFNPSQAIHAQTLAANGQSGAQLFNDAFEEFANRHDLPAFDFIALHGIWSWVSDENRAAIVSFINKNLKPGGVVYISYNTLPGWSAFAPIRQLMTEHAGTFGPPGGEILEKIDASIDFVQRFMDLDSHYKRANPVLLEKITQLRDKPKEYLAHEYFNRDWRPMYFSDIHRELSEAKLSYAQSANFNEHLEAVNFTAEQLEMLQTAPREPFGELLKDFLLNRQFRKDYWVKGKIALSPLAQREALERVTVTVNSADEEAPRAIKTELGEVALQEQIYRPLYECLLGYDSVSIGTLWENLSDGTMTFPQLQQALTVLLSSGHVAVAHEKDTTDRLVDQCTEFNKEVIERARFGHEINFVANPTTGGGTQLNRFQQLFTAALIDGKRELDEWALEAWRVISKQGQKVVRDNIALETEEENLAELRSVAGKFAETQLPLLQKHKIIA